MWCSTRQEMYSSREEVFQQIECSPSEIGNNLFTPPAVQPLHAQSLAFFENNSSSPKTIYHIPIQLRRQTHQSHEHHSIFANNVFATVFPKKNEEEKEQQQEYSEEAVQMELSAESVENIECTHRPFGIGMNINNSSGPAEESSYPASIMRQKRPNKSVERNPLPKRQKFARAKIAPSGMAAMQQKRDPVPKGDKNVTFGTAKGSFSSTRRKAIALFAATLLFLIFSAILIVIVLFSFDKNNHFYRT